MTYQVLARKWRPREFSSLIGQQAVVTALTNALRDGRIASAYLFSGIRGVGKTSAARLFAKALNCEKGPEVGPCNACAVCTEITAGSDLDVLEIDAATYSKVEQVRELTESLRYGPARDRYKVVVLDEVHRLSRQAFDALLKIVEEPPPRLVFIFATTEVDSVPATILSRCQEYHFRRVGAAELTRHLAEIATAEKIEASTRALALIARAGEGSVRDAVALLDQLATFGNGTIGDDEAARLVGGLDLELFARLLVAILAGESHTVSEIAHEAEEQGWDPRQSHTHFLGYCRDALHLALGAGLETIDLPREEAERLAGVARGAGYETVLRLLQHLLASEATVRRSDAGELALELAWLKAAELPKLLHVEQLLAGRPESTGEGGAPRQKPARAARPALVATKPPPATPPPAPAAQPVAALPAPPDDGAPPIAAPGPEPAGGADADSIARFRDELSARRPTLAARLNAARLEWRNGELAIELAGDDPLGAAQLARASNREMLGTAVTEIFGAGARWRLIEGQPLAAPTATAEDEAVAECERDAVKSDERVQAVLDIFGGSVTAVGRPETEKGEESG